MLYYEIGTTVIVDVHSIAYQLCQVKKITVDIREWSRIITIQLNFLNFLCNLVKCCTSTYTPE